MRASASSRPTIAGPRGVGRQPRQSSPRGAVLARPQVEACRLQAVASRSDRAGLVDMRWKIPASHLPAPIGVLRTNTKLSALQVVLRYRNLLAVEDTVKTTKALLTTRPIYKTDAAIRGYIFSTFLAVLLRKELFDRLAARRHSDLQWQHIVDDLDGSAKSRSADRRRACCNHPRRHDQSPMPRPRHHVATRLQESPPPAEPARCVVPKTSDGSQAMMHDYVYLETLEVGSDRLGVSSSSTSSSVGSRSRRLSPSATARSASGR